MQHHYAPHNPYIPPPQQAQPPQIKPEPVDNRYILSPYALPTLPGPQLNGMKPPTFPGGQQGILSFPPHPTHLARAPATSRPYNVSTTHPQSSAAPATQTQHQGTSSQTPPNQFRPTSPQKIPQADGPSSSSESPSPPPSQSYAPRPSHPSLPQPSQPSGTQPDSEAINSDLDDSDTEGEEDAEEGGQADSDIVFCTYDKVRSPYLNTQPIERRVRSAE